MKSLKEISARLKIAKGKVNNSSIKNKDSCAEDIKIMINNIQQKTGELVGLQSKLKDGDLVLKKLEKEKNRVNAMERGKILLMNPE